MPELPEVRVVSKFLKRETIGQIIKSIDVYYDRMMSDEVVAKLTGQKILNVLTSGKYIIFELEDYDLISHLRMEGKYYLPTITEVTKHDHVIFNLTDKQIRYNDTRKFGTFDLRKKDKTWTTPPLSKLGKEPFVIDENDLYKTLKKSNSPIKVLLLNQHIIAGIGNIYADEILFSSKIHPLKKGSELTKKDVRNIIDSSIDILNRAIEKGGTTISSFKNDGHAGWFSQDLFVHTRHNEPCKICNTPIDKIKVGGRSSYFCKTCQRR